MSKQRALLFLATTLFSALIYWSGVFGSASGVEHQSDISNALVSPPASKSINKIPTKTSNNTFSKPFSFALVGDLPYTPNQLGAFKSMVDTINKDKSIDLVVHAGDIKGGGERCDNALIDSRFMLYQGFKPPFVYTPGDNEWADCHRKSNGTYYPLERLKYLREKVFPTLNANLLAREHSTVSQGDMPGYKEFVENVRFTKHGVIFATLHVIGSNNNLLAWKGYDAKDSTKNPRLDRIRDFERRRNAALVWLDVTFEQAVQQNAKAVFLIMHANPRLNLSRNDKKRAGFIAITDRIQMLSEKFQRPVVLSHGDHHTFFVDKPFISSNRKNTLLNLTRVQSFGYPMMRWVKVTVQDDDQNFFVFEAQ